jgi:hypothetical protein
MTFGICNFITGIGPDVIANTLGIFIKYMNITSIIPVSEGDGMMGAESFEPFD